jgi:16S rRNA (cytidine1402-2'-O)-methyltransferase
MLEEEIDRRIDEGLSLGRRPKDIADEIALESGLPRRDLYARVVGRKRDGR